jgi:putative NADH-flavin reductase
MRVLIFGASGRAGKYVVKEALERGHVVVAFTRNAAGFPLGHPKLDVVRGDVLDYPPVLAAMGGAHGVICALGAPNIKGATIISRGTANIVRAMREQGVRRLICLTSAGLFGQDDGFVLGRFIGRLFLGHVMEDKRRQAGILEASGLDWVLVRAVRFSEKPATGRYEITFRRPASRAVALADLAEFMLLELESGAHFRLMPIVSSPR